MTGLLLRLSRQMHMDTGLSGFQGNWLSEGISDLAVAFTEEAKILRESGINSRILVLFDSSDIAEFFAYDLMPVIYDTDRASALSKEAIKRNKRIPVQLKIDTGMGRTGFMADKAVSAAELISDMEGIEIAGLLSHFPEADSDDKSTSIRQIEVFNNILNAIEEKTGRKLIAHMSNSAALFSLKEGLFDAVRPGLVLYGYSPFQESYGLMTADEDKDKDSFHKKIACWYACQLRQVVYYKEGE